MKTVTTDLDHFSVSRAETEIYFFILLILPFFIYSGRRTNVSQVWTAQYEDTVQLLSVQMPCFSHITEHIPSPENDVLVIDDEFSSSRAKPSLSVWLVCGKWRTRVTQRLC